MKDSQSRSQSLVSPDTFTREVEKAMCAMPYTPAVHNGKRNPYTGEIVFDAESYYTYLRNNVYNRLCDEYFRRHFEQLAALQAEQLTLQYREDLRKVRFLWLSRVVCLLLALAAVLFVYIPSREEASYGDGKVVGYDRGYESGYDAGYNSGHDAGYGMGYDKGVLAGGAEGRAAGYDEGYEDGAASRSSGVPQFPSTPQNDTFTVYVSRSGGKIHTSSGCSGMRYYTEMTYAEAVAAGYDHCSKCF